jgi:group I intron endonuclease
MRIYKITNRIDGKQYIGQTSGTLTKRFTSHVCAARNGSTSLIHNAIRNYGKDVFDIEPLQECQSVEGSDEAERKWIADLNTIAPHGYNVEPGGCRNRAPMAEATRAKLREARKDLKHRYPEWYEKICHAARNRSPDWKRKIAEAHKGKKATAKQRAALAAGAKLRHVNGTTKGEANGRAILTWEKVAQIRQMYATGEYSQEQLGLLFGVKQITISVIVRHKRWKVNNPPVEGSLTKPCGPARLRLPLLSRCDFHEVFCMPTAIDRRPQGLDR